MCVLAGNLGNRHEPDHMAALADQNKLLETDNLRRRHLDHVTRTCSSDLLATERCLAFIRDLPSSVVNIV